MGGATGASGTSAAGAACGFVDALIWVREKARRRDPAGLSAVIDAAENPPLVSRPRSALAPASHFYATKGIESVNKMDLIATVADQTDLSRIKASEVVDAVFGAIEGALKKKEEVRLVGFGTFQTAERKAATGRNPRTGEEMSIPASTTVRFKAGKGLKDAVQ
jgi:DNA-binding protein HU-beta